MIVGAGGETAGVFPCFANHGLHEGLFDSRNGFADDNHCAEWLPAVLDQPVHFGCQTVGGRGGSDFVFGDSHTVLSSSSAEILGIDLPDVETLAGRLFGDKARGDRLPEGLQRFRLQSEG